MSKKTARIIIWSVVLLLFAGLIAFYFFFLRERVDFLGPEGRGLLEFFPFGSQEGGGPDGEGGPDGGPDGEGGPDVPIPVLRQISEEPIAGATTIEAPEQGTTKIRFMERATGHVYETTTDSLVHTRIANTTIPRVYDALWVENGESVILRYLSEDGEGIRSFYGAITPRIGGDSTDAGEIVGVFLSENILDIAVSEDTERIAYLETFGTGSHVIIADPDGENKREIYISPLAEWLLEWPEDDTVVLTTSPSFAAQGFSYFIDTETGLQERVLANLFGLTTQVAPGAARLLYTQSTRAGVRLSYQSLVGENTAPRTVSVVTMPEKCAWSRLEETVVYCGVPLSISRSGMPDVWYQGRTLFIDAIWKINVESGEADLLITPHETLQGATIDVIEPFLNEGETHLFFTNKRDLTLWSLKLE